MIIIFTSDNGPFFAGRAAGLKGGKGNALEGGHRVPFIAAWPRVMRPGRTSIRTTSTTSGSLPCGRTDIVAAMKRELVRARAEFDALRTHPLEQTFPE